MQKSTFDYINIIFAFADFDRLGYKLWFRGTLEGFSHSQQLSVIVGRVMQETGPVGPGLGHKPR